MRNKCVSFSWLTIVLLLLTNLQTACSSTGGQNKPDPNESIDVKNTKPVANAGLNQAVIVNNAVTIDGTESSDADGDTLSYTWSFISIPEGSTSVIKDTKAVVTSFVPDKAGSYIVRLVVNDGLIDSDPSTAEIQARTKIDEIVSFLQVAEKQVASLTPEVFRDSAMQKQLLNKYNIVIENINMGNYDCALKQLVKGVLPKIDGCNISCEASPDEDDWITDCESQRTIYAYTEKAREELVVYTQLEFGGCYIGGLVYYNGVPVNGAVVKVYDKYSGALECSKKTHLLLLKANILLACPLAENIKLLHRIMVGCLNKNTVLSVV